MIAALLKRNAELAKFEQRKAAGLFDVPCNGCTLCCKGDAVRILPHEDPTRWQTEPHPRLPGARVLAHRTNGDCVYLGESGCTIQEGKPQQCYEMDCRRLAANLSKSQAKRLDAQGALPIAVFKRGQELLATHPLIGP